MSQQPSETTMIVVDERDAANNNGQQSDHHLYKDPHAMFARYIYTVILILGCILAWAVRNNHVLSFFERQRHNGCQGKRDCLATEAILLICFTLFLFYMIMFFSTANTKKVQDKRHVWHSHPLWWPAKLALLAICIIPSTVAPSDVIQLYGKVSPFGGGILIFIQVMSVIRYVTRLNYKWCLTNLEERYLRVIVVSILGYSGSMVGTILMGLWYADCWQNITFIVVTLLLVHLMSLISMISKAKGFYMEPGLLGAYIAFLCWSAIRRWSMDAGWTSTWVHLANEGLVIIFFVLILIARIYSIDWLRQRLEGFFGTEGKQGGGESRTTELEMTTGPTPLPPLPQTTTDGDLQISVPNNDDIGALSSSNDSEPAGSPSALVITTN